VEWLEASKAYLEIGILGLCAILVVSMAWFYFKRTQTDADKKDKKIDNKDKVIEDKYASMFELLQNQLKEYQEQQGI